MSLKHQLALTFIKGIGPTLSRSLLAYFGHPEKIFEVPAARFAKVPGIGSRIIEQLNLPQALERAEAEEAYVKKHGIDVIFYTDERYPKRLKNCNDAPILLYSKGNADLNNRRAVSIVGTRNATDYGRALCKQLIDDLQQYGVLIVSGLAAGIDVAAHKESLRAELPTVGVLGHGLDRLYPSQNRQTADKMLLNGGLLTEYPSGTKPDRENFPARNRIVAGMADVTVVIEAGIKGGALITAEIANSYDRDVFAFPGRITDEYSEGCNFLIRHNKAGLLTCAADLAHLMGWDTEKDNAAKPKAKQFALPIDLTADERNIWDILQHAKAPVSIDDLAIKLSMPLSKLAMDLLNMEMQGYISAKPGKMYVIG
ncbi:DNA-processing protein DprA [Mucilaginibacter daejeonensis]|uniref:DNA-processing protein DprA n=1 Tax=Mucilaginibacter daejeonensis TaxID=398049 RepID=UPI001D178449|nr:DNA-processing protein DprA [Mucilaginibacter daejeonensis]UEG52337.1 DNA-processing protein DprA [Mucilaginibacter daejeonensis]